MSRVTGGRGRGARWENGEQYSTILLYNLQFTVKKNYSIFLQLDNKENKSGKAKHFNVFRTEPEA